MKSVLSGLMRAGAMLVATGLISMSFVPAAFADAGPAVVISSTDPSTTPDTNIPITVTFSEPVSNFSSGTVTVTNGGINAFTGSGTDWSFNVNPFNPGTVTVMVDAGAADDASDTPSQASNTLTFDYSPAGGNSGSGTASTTQISDIMVSDIASTTATISWNTDQGADGQVYYGETSTYNASSTYDATPVMSHTAFLGGLSPSTTYHYEVLSNNANGLATSADQTFITTDDNGDTGTSTLSAAPVISDVMVSDIASTTATITWDTDIASNGQVAYGETSNYDASSTLDTTSTTTHTAFLGGLVPSTTYHFEAMSQGSGALGTSGDETFTTTDENGDGGSSGTSTPLALDGITTTRGAATPDGNLSDGWEWDFQFTVPADDTNFSFELGDFVNQANSSETIPIAGNATYYSPESSNASTAASAVTITDANDYGTGVLDITGSTSTSTDSNTIDVIVDVAVPSGTAAGTYSASFGAQSLAP